MITVDLLAAKLKNWTLSCKVQETLGLSSMDEASFRKQLEAFEKQGFLIKEGARRGLKYKYVEKESIFSDEYTEAEKDGDSKEEEKQISTLAAYLHQKAHDKTESAKAKTFAEALAFLLKAPVDSDPCIRAYTLALKHSSDGVQLKIYAGLLPLVDTVFTKHKFVKYLQESGVAINV